MLWINSFWCDMKIVPHRHLRKDLPNRSQNLIWIWATKRWLWGNYIIACRFLIPQPHSLIYMGHTQFSCQDRIMKCFALTVLGRISSWTTEKLLVLSVRTNHTITPYAAVISLGKLFHMMRKESYYINFEPKSILSPPMQLCQKCHTVPKEETDQEVLKGKGDLFPLIAL